MPYYPSGIDSNVLQLLRFARRSKNVDPVKTASETDATIEALNSLTTSTLPDVHALIPLIYNNLVESPLRDQVASETFTYLRNMALQLVARELTFKAWLDGALNQFKQHDLTVMLIKGAAFSESLYTDSAPRLGTDIDLLFKKQDFDTARKLLLETMEPLAVEGSTKTTYSAGFEMQLKPKGSDMPMVEIHRQLKNPYIFNINAEAIWEASREHPKHGSELVRILSAEDTLLHLAVHGFRDLNYWNHGLLDAHEVLSQWNPDPILLLEKAKNWKATHVLYVLLINCKDIMNSPVPDSLLDQLSPGPIKKWAGNKILTSPELLETTSKSGKYRVLQLASQTFLPDSFFRSLKFLMHYFKTTLYS